MILTKFKSLLKKVPQSSAELANVRALAVCAMMLALRVVLGMFTNFTLAIVPFVKLGFSFLPVAITAYLYGPVCAAIVSGMGDVLSIILANPTAFSIHPGITLCSVLEGIVYGLALYRSQLKPANIILSEALVVVLVRLPLNTLFLSTLMGMEYPSLLLFRTAILVPWSGVEVLILLVSKKLLLRVNDTVIHRRS